MYRTIPKTVFPRHTLHPPAPVRPPFVIPAPFRHSGESRNPEDTFPLDPGFRRGDEGGRRGDVRARRGDEGGAPAEAGIPPQNSRLRGNDDRVGSSRMSFPFPSSDLRVRVSLNGRTGNAKRILGSVSVRHRLRAVLPSPPAGRSRQVRERQRVVVSTVGQERRSRRRIQRRCSRWTEIRSLVQTVEKPADDGALHGPRRYDVEFPNRAVYITVKNAACKKTEN